MFLKKFFLNFFWKTFFQNFNLKIGKFKSLQIQKLKNLILEI